ncbi:MAG: cupredoxin domain-containing protein [Elusimicrobia bacterium]|nr:cupredoxin domain-containing protein [Elusimicrobiota bacterium]
MARRTPLFLAALLAAGAAPARAWPWSPKAPMPEVRLTIKGRAFVPAELDVPAGVKFKLVVANEDGRPSEFESYVLNREQVVPAHGKTTVYLGPLKPGRYEFFDDFQSGVKGTLKAAAPKAAKP